MEIPGFLFLRSYDGKYVMVSSFGGKGAGLSVLIIVSVHIVVQAFFSLTNRKLTFQHFLCHAKYIQSKKWLTARSTDRPI